MKELRVKAGKKFRLKDWDCADTRHFSGGKEEAEKQIDALTKRLGQLQNLLYAENRHKILIVLQGMDTSGKDGAIRCVFDDVNPQGVRVMSFKQPTEKELAHDYLWRVHPHVPAAGQITIFNRSHYEDVLVPRAHKLIKPDVWKRRYGQINDFERMIVEEGTTILKFFLHISKDEQKARLEDRLKDPKKRWKFREGDIQERKLWKEYQQAYEDLIEATTTQHAPWHIVAADKKWYRNWTIAKTIVGALESMDLKYPQVKINPNIKIV